MWTDFTETLITVSFKDVAGFIKSTFVMVQYILFGDGEVTDLDGTSLPENEMAKRWGIVFTPKILFMPRAF